MDTNELLIEFCNFNHSSSEEEWRRNIFLKACKCLDISTDKIENDFSDSEIVRIIKNELGVTSHFFLHSKEFLLEGHNLSIIKTDISLLNKQTEIVNKIKKDKRYKKEYFKNAIPNPFFSIQFGVQRKEMWKEVLGFWKTQYSTTWEDAFYELIWTINSTRVYYSYVVDEKGNITITYSFSDILDLKPNFGKNIKYNAICVVLGFLYHDILGSSDSLEIKARWTTKIQ